MATYCCINALLQAANTKKEILSVVKAVCSITQPDYSVITPKDVTKPEYISFIYTKSLLADFHEMDKQWHKEEKTVLFPLFWIKLFREWNVQNYCELEHLVDWCADFADMDQMTTLIRLVKLPISIYQIVISKYNIKWSLEQMLYLCELLNGSKIYMNVQHMNQLISIKATGEQRLAIVNTVLAQAVHTNHVSIVAAMLLHQAQHVFFDKELLSMRKLVDSKTIRWLINNCTSEKEAIDRVRKLMNSKHKPDIDIYVWEDLEAKRYYILAKIFVNEYFKMPPTAILHAYKNMRIHLGLQRDQGV